MPVVPKRDGRRGRRHERRASRRPESRADLWLFIHERFGIRLPHRAFTEGHSTPLDLVADAFFHPDGDLAVWANRSGLKTLSASIVAALEFRFSDVPLKARVLSGSEDQARNLYEYWCRWCGNVLSDLLVGSPGRLLTRLQNGDMEILAASQKRVRGAKVQRLFRDEVDEIDPDVLAASVGMLASTDGATARTIDTSTWHRVDGPMGRLVAEADSRGIRLHKWNVWESLQRCPTERHEHGRGCRSCKLAGPCLAKAREYHRRCDPQVGIAADCCGLLSIDDAVKQLRHWSVRQWQAEAECTRPSPVGLVYSAFDRRTHVRDELTFDPALPTWRSVDWGWHDFVCLWLQEDRAGCVRVVDEYWATSATTVDHARSILARDDGRRIEATYCDPAGLSRNDQTGYSDIEIFDGMGLPCTWRTSARAREVRNGINLIRSFLAPADGPPRLLVAGRCRRLIQAFETYRNRQINGEFVDEPVKPQEFDHPMDALRYYFVNRVAAGQSEARPLSYA
jgi:hypothetical protein